MPGPFCDSVWIQTRNLLIRSQMLYSVELRSRFPVWECKRSNCFKLNKKNLAFFFKLTLTDIR
jgi:hypothetical protein